MKLTVILDMDGTIADLYKVENWLGKIRNFDPTPYPEAALMVVGIAEAVKAIREAGAEVKVGDEIELEIPDLEEGDYISIQRKQKIRKLLLSK